MIGIFNDNFPPILDGVAVAAQNYAYWLHKKGYESCVITPYAPHSREVIAAAPYPIFRYASVPIPMRKPYRFGLPQVSLNFKRQIKGIRFDLVHTHCPFTSGLLAGCFTWGSPSVSTLECLISFLGQTVAHRPQLSHLE